MNYPGYPQDSPQSYGQDGPQGPGQGNQQGYGQGNQQSNHDRDAGEMAAERRCGAITGGIQHREHAPFELSGTRHTHGERRRA